MKKHGGRPLIPVSGPYLEKQLRSQSFNEMLCEALAILGQEKFRKFCDELNKEHFIASDGRRRFESRGRVRSIWTLIHETLAESPARELRSAFKDIAIDVRECEDRALRSPLRGKVRQILLKIAEAADRIAEVLNDNEVAASRPSLEPTSNNGAWITAVRSLLSDVTCRGDDLSVRTEAANDNISVGESKRAYQIVFGADRNNPLLGRTETVEIIEPLGPLTHGRTPAERETALRLAVEQWAGRHLAASTISSKLRTHIRRVRKDAKFLIEIEALDRHLAGSTNRCLPLIFTSHQTLA